MATTHGLAVYNSSQELIYSSADVTWNQVDYFEVTASVNGSFVVKNYTTIIGKEVLVLQILIDAPPTTRRAIAHTITYNNTGAYNSATGLGGGSVKVTGGSEKAFILVLMR
jgi:hypothetical protein